MTLSKRRTDNLALVCFMLAVCELLLTASPRIAAQTGPRRFTVADDIGITRVSSEVMFSPDDRFFIVTSDRGRLDINRVESFVRVYSTSDIQKLLSEHNTQKESAPLRFKAASIYQGPNYGYLQYLIMVDNGGYSHQEEAAIGSSPSGAGLTQWLNRSPGFNMDKVDTPLRIVAGGREDVLWMWESYAVLRFLNKPVDLIVSSTEEHELTNPAGRMTSQGGALDWFRFWLTGEEDPDPAKAEQYARWQKMREQRIAESHAREAEISSGR